MMMKDGYECVCVQKKSQTIHLYSQVEDLEVNFLMEFYRFFFSFFMMFDVTKIDLWCVGVWLCCVWWREKEKQCAKQTVVEYHVL